MSYHPEQKKVSARSFVSSFLTAWLDSLFLASSNRQMPISIFLSRQSRDRIASLSRDSFDNNLKKKKRKKIHPSSPHVRLALSSSCYCTPDVYTVLSVLLSRYFLSPALTCRLTAATFSNGEKKKKPKILFLLIFLLDQTETTHKKNVFLFLFFFERNLRLERGDKNKIFPTKTVLCV